MKKKTTFSRAMFCFFSTVKLQRYPVICIQIEIIIYQNALLILKCVILMRMTRRFCSFTALENEMQKSLLPLDRAEMKPEIAETWLQNLKYGREASTPLSHRDKTRVQMPAKIFPHLKVKS
jgi:hypothetical protein